MPRIISPDEAHKLGLQHFGKKHPVRAMLETMERGQLLHITRTEFNWKGHTPMRICNEISKTTTMKFKIMHTQNKKGWVVERVE